MILEKADELEAVDVRHVDVGEDRVEFVMRQQLQRFESVSGLDDLDAVGAVFNGVRKIGPHRCGVFDEEDFHCSRSDAALSNADPACERKISRPVMSSIGARCSALSPYRIPIVRLPCMIGSATTSVGERS